MAHGQWQEISLFLMGILRQWDSHHFQVDARRLRKFRATLRDAIFCVFFDPS